LLGALDCFWQSAGNRLNLPLLEAMSAGVPVVAADTLTNRELIAPEENGVLVPLGDRASFARRTQVLLDDVSLARRLGDAGRASIVERFPPGRTIEQWATLYQKIVERDVSREDQQTE
jgi:glycosyltransferase involved in cell wall biosynthesis